MNYVIVKLIWPIDEWTNDSLYLYYLVGNQPACVGSAIVQAKVLKGQICQICEDDVGLTADGELFVACNECAFPVCPTCYEYERSEGTQLCPKCKTRFKRLKGGYLLPKR